MLQQNKESRIQQWQMADNDRLINILQGNMSIEIAGGQAASQLRTFLVEGVMEYKEYTQRHGELQFMEEIIGIIEGVKKAFSEKS